MGTGRAHLITAMPGILARLSERLPSVLIESLREQLGEINRIEKRIADTERRIRELSKGDPAVNAIMYIPGVGL